MSPQNAKAFLHLLAESVQQYENIFGEINLLPDEEVVESMQNVAGVK